MKNQNAFNSVYSTENAKGYWINQFSEKVIPIHLPHDYVNNDNYEKDTYHFDFNENLSNKLIESCQNNDMLIFIMLLTTLNIQLSKYVNENQITLGIPLYGENNNQSKLQDNQSIFIKTYVDKEMTVEELLFKLKKELINNYRNQHYSIDKVLNIMKINKSMQDFISISIGMMNLHMKKSLESISNSTKNELLITCEKLNSGMIVGCVTYNSKIFKKITIKNFINNFINTCTNILNNINSKINHVEAISKEEKNKLVYEFNNAYTNYPKDKTIHELFEEQVEKTPNNIAVVFQDKELTYKELNEKSNSLARVLRSKGIKPDSFIGIMVERSLEMIIGILAILKAGGAYLPIDSSYPKERIEYMLKDSESKILLSTENLIANIKFDGEVVDLIDEGLFNGNFSNLEIVNGSRDLAYIIYTSGTTGNPKGVMVEHRSVNNLIQALRKNIYFMYNSQLRVALVAPYYFDASIQQIFAALVDGYSLYIVPEDTRKNGEELLKYYERNFIDISDGTPIHLNMISNLINNKSRFNLKHLIIGGDKLFKEPIQNIYENFPDVKISNVYGPTECCVDSSIYLVESNNIDLLKNIPIGKPIQNSKAYIVDKNYNLMPIGAYGELCVGGDGLARGYLNNPELTAEKFVENPFELGTKMYKTGDLARWMHDGNIEFLGRIDNQVKIRGFRIELGEIENRLLQHEDIKEAAVVVKENKETDQYICAYVVCEREINKFNLKSYLKESLPEYMVPSYFVQVEKMPLTQNGKLDRKALPEPSLDANLNEYEAPRNDVEEKLSKIWSEILGIEKVGINDNFFELGGHSLKATMLLGRIHKILNVEIPLREIFTLQTIKGISEYIKLMEKSIYTEIRRIVDKDYYEVSSAQKRMYIVQEFDKESTHYNMLQAVYLEGNLEIEKVERTFLKLIERHESLRTSIKNKNDIIVQEVHKLEDIEFSVDEIIIEKVEEVEEKIKNFSKSFNLEQAPLFRVGIIKSEEEKHILVLDMHHIISDGSSIGILIKEFMEIYEGKEQQELRIQYKDFAVWQNNLCNSEEFKKQEKYWLERFSDNIPVLNLPVDYQRPDILKYQGAHISFILDKTLTTDLHLLAKNTNTTLYMILLSAINILFHKYSKQDDIIIGSPIAGRGHADLNSVVGMFVNTLAMRNFPEKTKTFNEFLREVKENTLQAFENQDLQFEELVTRINVPRSVNRNPLFNVSFAFQNMYMPKFAENDMKLKVIPYNVEDSTSKFDLTFFASENLGQIDFVLEYSTELYNESTIKAMIRCLINVLIQIVKEPQMKIKEINMLTQDEEKEVTIDLNKTYSQYPNDKTIHQLIEEQVNKTPDEIAIVFHNKNMTYRELNEKANRLANFLVYKAEIKPGELVGILMDKSDDAIIAILGALKVGAAYIPIEPNWPEERVKTIIDEANIKVVISSKKYLKTLNELQWECSTFNYYICMDCSHVYLEEEGQNELMNEELWQYIGESSNDDIEAGGWRSSYTGEKFSRLEMDEYSNNIMMKLRPYLNNKVKVLEIGCASGLSMFKIAPYVGEYYGTDLSQSIINKNKQRILKDNINNIKLQCIPAHEIDRINEDSFDIVILNSVVQSFHGHNYLRKTIRKIINLMSDKGIIFFGDIMDKDLQGELVKSLIDFKMNNNTKNYNTKTDFTSELFLSKGFFNDLYSEFNEINSMYISDKICTIENELTKYRYDVVVETNKHLSNRNIKKLKYQYGTDILMNYDVSFISVKLNGNDLAYVIYTSGSTGKPKGVMITHQGLVNYICWAIKAYTQDEKLKFPLYSSLSFDLTVTSIFTPLITGGSIVIYDGTNNDYEKSLLIVNILKENVVNILKLTPAHLKLIENIDCRESNIKRLIVGGEQLTTKLAKKIYSCFGEKVEIFNEYGPTEAVVGCMTHKFNIEKDNREVVPIGVPVDNAQIYLLDEGLKPVPIGVDGHMYISGVGVARGYLNNDRLTAQQFIKNPFRAGDTMYKTGDIAKRLHNGSLEFLGRVDQQVKINGYRIEIAEIEHYMSQNSNISEAIVIDKLDDNGDKYICAYFIGEENCTIGDVRDQLKKKLPDYMIPSYFIKLEEMPLNRNGKIDKKALPEPYREIVTRSKYEVARDNIEEKLVTMWQEILGMKNIGINDNFFELGGHSLKATILIGRIHKELNQEIPLRQIFTAGTIKEISEYIKSQPKGNSIYRKIEKIEEKEYYEASSAQKRMYMLQEFNKKSVVYNMSSAIEIEGKLEIEKIEETFSKLIDRHETLRTSFQLSNDNIVQKVHKIENIEFKVEELLIEYKSEIKKKIKSFIRNFDLGEAPLLRCGIVKLEEERHILVFDMHHIISDGVSIEILTKEFGEIYGGKKQEKLRIQYKDYTAWHNEMQKKEEFKKQEQYWLKEFEGEIPLLRMPIDYERTEMQSYDGESIIFMIEKEETHKLKEISRETGSTMYMVLLSGVNILLSKYSGQEDIVVGTPIAGRPHSDLQNMIGMFVNTLALRSKINIESSYEEYLNQTKEKTIRAFENQDYQFNDFVEKLNVKRELNRNLLFDIMFTMENIETNEIIINDLVLKKYSMDNTTSKFDILITATEIEEKVMFSFEYCTKLYKKETVNKMIKHFKNILNQISNNKNIKLKDISILSESEFKIASINVKNDIEDSIHSIEFDF